MIGAAELDLFGCFPGHDVSLDRAEHLLWTRWPQRERAAEPELFGTRWWDYRCMHPVHATYLFNHILTSQVRKIIREHLNDAPAREAANGTVLDWNPIKAGDVMQPPKDSSRIAYWQRKLGGLIRARQAADEDGIPYEVFIRAGLHFFYFGPGTYVMQRNDMNGQRRMMPEPNLLYGETCRLSIREAWLGELQKQVQSASHPRYRLENDDGHPDHAAHRVWLMQQLDRRAVQEFVAERLVKDRLLGADQALSVVRYPEKLQARLR